MEIAEALRIGYKTALSGLTFNSQLVPVFGLGSIPENQKPPYVILSTYTGYQRMVDRCKVYECTQLVEIVTTSKSPSGFGDALSIAYAVENAINPDSFIDIDITSNGYKIGETSSIDTTTRQDKGNTEYVYRVLKRYRHLISKTT